MSVFEGLKIALFCGFARFSHTQCSNHQLFLICPLNVIWQTAEVLHQGLVADQPNSPLHSPAAEGDAADRRIVPVVLTRRRQIIKRGSCKTCVFAGFRTFGHAEPFGFIRGRKRVFLSRTRHFPHFNTSTPLGAFLNQQLCASDRGINCSGQFPLIHRDKWLGRGSTHQRQGSGKQRGL